MVRDQGRRPGSPTLVSARAYRDSLRLVRSVADAADDQVAPLGTIGGFKSYAPVVRRVFGPVCVLGQVIRKNRVVRVAAKTVIGPRWKLDELPGELEDSFKLSMAFIERLNPTIRQGSAYGAGSVECRQGGDCQHDDQSGPG